MLGGLVAITASSSMVDTHGAFFIGMVSGVLVFYGSKLMLMVKARYTVRPVFLLACVSLVVVA